MKKPAKRIPIIALLVVLAGCAAGGGTVHEFRSFPLEELRADFSQFRRTIENSHPMLYADRGEVSELLDRQYEAIRNGMEEIEFFRLLRPVVAALRCGHTHLWPSQEYRSFIYDEVGVLPFHVRILGGRIFHFEDLADTGIPAGSEITVINGQPAAELLESLRNLASSDGLNVTKKDFDISWSLGANYAYLVDLAPAFEVGFVSPEGTENTVILKPVTADRMHPRNFNEGELYSKELGEDYAVLTVLTFAFYQEPARSDFMAFIDEFFAEVSAAGTPAVILDLRSGGGDPYCTAHLFSYLISEPAPYFSENIRGAYYDLQEDIVPSADAFDGEVYSLINGTTFSSTSHLAALLKYHGIGIFIGEESGGSFACTDSSRDSTLRNTGIGFHYSTQVWDVAVSGLEPGRGIKPDITVTPTIGDLLSGRDPLLETAVSLIEGR